MTIKAIRMFDGGFISQPFAFGGEEGKEAFDDQINYRQSLQNYWNGLFRLDDKGDSIPYASTRGAVDGRCRR